MTIELLSTQDTILYKKFIQQHPNGSLFQSLAWRDYQEQALHLKSFILVGKEQGQIHNAALLFRYPLPFHKSYLYAPRGPLFGPDPEKNVQLMEAIEKLAKKEQAIFFRFDPLLPATADLADVVKLKSFKQASSVQPKTTLLLDITRSENEILAQMKEKGRYNIRLAQKKGVEVTPGTIQELYPLLRETSQRDGFHVHEQKVYETMLHTFGNDILLLVARYGQEVIAGGIFVCDRDTLIYYYGASGNAHRNVMAPYLVQWTAILEGKKRACTTYDFLGIAEENEPNHPWAGVTEFKLKFGGEKKSYIGAFEVVYNKFWTMLYHLRKKV